MTKFGETPRELISAGFDRWIAWQSERAGTAHGYVSAPTQYWLNLSREDLLNLLDILAQTAEDRGNDHWYWARDLRIKMLAALGIIEEA